MAEDAGPKVHPILRSRLKVNRLLAEAYSVIQSIEETRYLSNMPMDQMIDQAIRQLGRPGGTGVSGQPDPPDKPPTGRRSRRSRLEAIQRKFKDELQHLQDLPDLSNPKTGEDLMPSLGDASGMPTAETTR